MTSYKISVFQLEEIKNCTIVCRACGTEVTVQIDAETAPIPKGCPTSTPPCGKRFDGLSDAIGLLRKAYSLATTNAIFKVELHIKELGDPGPEIGPLDLA